MNHFNGIGRLAAAAELKYTSKGIACTKFSICINKKWKDADGNRQEKPNFFNCVMWGKLGETISKYLTKGKQVAIEGELDQNSWTDNSGNNHSSVQIIVDNLEMLASPKGEKDSGADNSAPPGNEGKNAPGAEDIPF